MTITLRALAVVIALVLVSGATAAAQPSGTVTFGVHVTLATRWLDPSDTEAFITPFMVLYAIHDALVKPMPAGDNTPSLAESWTASTSPRLSAAARVDSSGMLRSTSRLTLGVLRQ